MNRFQTRIWLRFTLWLAGAIVVGMLGHFQKSTWFLSVYMILSAAITMVGTKKNRPPNYKFQLVAPGVVRSPLGFEIHMSRSGMKYVEGDHTVSLTSTSANSSVGVVSIPGDGLIAWDTPFANEFITQKKKEDMRRALLSAAVWLQLVESGKIRPKTPAIPTSAEI